jgi:hypothetical protein
MIDGCPRPVSGDSQHSANHHSQLFAGQARDMYFGKGEGKLCLAGFGCGITSTLYLNDVLNSLPTTAAAPFNAYQRQHDPIIRVGTGKTRWILAQMAGKEKSPKQDWYVLLGAFDLVKKMKEKLGRSKRKRFNN